MPPFLFPCYIPCLALMSAATTFSSKVPSPIPKPNLARCLYSSRAHESPIVAKSVSNAPDQGKGCSLNLPLPIPDSHLVLPQATHLCVVNRTLLCNSTKFGSSEPVKFSARPISRKYQVSRAHYTYTVHYGRGCVAST